MMFEREVLARRLDALVVFRSLLKDPTLQRLVSFLHWAVGGAGPNELVGPYAEFVAALLESGSAGLADHVREVVCDDDNAYTRTLGAGEGARKRLADIVARELETLQAVADLTPDDLLADLADEDYLPGFVTGRVDLVADYRERVANAGRVGFGIFARYHAFCLDGGGAIVPVRHPDPIRLADLVDYEREKAIVLDNTRALLAGKPAANVLLTGDAGTGKSSTVKAIANELYPDGLRILQVHKEQLHLIPEILDQLTSNPLKFIIFIDDLSFSGDDDNYAALKGILEGSVSAKSQNVVIYATSNRRHIVRETFSEREGDEVHFNDTMQELLSLSERFGIHVTYSKPNKATYLDIVHRLADEAEVNYDPADLDQVAERYALRRGGRSARGARQFVDALVSGSQSVRPRGD